MAGKSGRKASPAQLEYEQNYTKIIFDDVPTEFVQVDLPTFINHLRTKENLTHLQISVLMGCSPDTPMKIEKGINTSFGMKVIASVLRRFTYKGKAVVVEPFGSPQHVIDMYDQFFRQFAFGDGKLHDCGLDGSEGTRYAVN